MEARPIEPAERDALFAPLAEATGILAAVSGGPDSVALMHLLAEWAGPGGRPPVTVASVDHGLRPEAAAEAAAVGAAAASLGLAHRVLAWSGPKPRAGLQAAARAARYRLLVAAARDLGATHLVTAHTLDDQAETILIRLARGSGLAGLAGMRPAVERGGIRHARPLLAVPKARLVAICRARCWRFVDDPSNADPRFARSRWRALMPALAEQGLDAPRLAALAERARRAEDALDLKARQALEAARRGPALAAAALCEEPFEIALRMLTLAVLHGRGPEAGPLRLQRLEACLTALRAAAARGEALRRTIGGTVVSLDRSGKISIGPETPRRRGSNEARRAPLTGPDAGVPEPNGNGCRSRLAFTWQQRPPCLD